MGDLSRIGVAIDSELLRITPAFCLKGSPISSMNIIT